MRKAASATTVLLAIMELLKTRSSLPPTCSSLLPTSSSLLQSCNTLLQPCNALLELCNTLRQPCNTLLQSSKSTASIRRTPLLELWRPHPQYGTLDHRHRRLRNMLELELSLSQSCGSEECSLCFGHSNTRSPKADPAKLGNDFRSWTFGHPPIQGSAYDLLLQDTTNPLAI
jgi:hypothetical protein